MTTENSLWRVGIIGLGPAGLFLSEKLSLLSDIRVIGVFDSDPVRSGLISDQGCLCWEQPMTGISSREIDAVFFMQELTPELVSLALNNGKHVIVHQPWRLSSNSLAELAKQAKSENRTATVSSLERWSAAFCTVLDAKTSGRLGTLQTVRFSSCEMSVPLSPKSLGIVREFGYRWLDQLQILVDSSPYRILAKRFLEANADTDCGVWATIEFVNGCLAHLDLQTRSRLAHRSGWMLEGSTGSYQMDRVYTVTRHGEVIDEPLPTREVPFDQFFEALKSTWRGEASTLTSLAEAARVMRLIEAIEQSANSGQIVCL